MRTERTPTLPSSDRHPTPASVQAERGPDIGAAWLPPTPFRPARETDLAEQFVVATLTDRAYAATASPLELCIRAEDRTNKLRSGSTSG
jgi:hypothetical protein